MTKKDRNRIYKEALDSFTEEHMGYTGLCYHINKARDIIENSPDPYLKMSAYPEIYKHKPEKYFTWIGHWWDLTDREIRIKVLKQAIKETES